MLVEPTSAILRQKAHAVTPEMMIQVRILEIVAEELSRVRQENNAAGIAAPQIGEPIRMINFVYRGLEHTIINPVIKHKKGSVGSLE